jgi:hypothetical protein
MKCWMEFSSLVNRLGSTLSTSVFSFKLITLIVNEKFNYTKKISQISMYYVEERADNSGYTIHRVTCLVHRNLGYFFSIIKFLINYQSY